MKKADRWAHPRKRNYDQLDISLRFLPPEISTISVTCSTCNKSFIPNWNEKRHSTHPVNHNSLPIIFVPTGVQVRCKNPYCNAMVNINFPNTKKEGVAHTFIDEAYRHVSIDRCLTNYSSISVRPKHLSLVSNEWENFKSLLVKESILTNSFIHVTELKEKDSKLCIEVLKRTCNWLNCIIDDIGDQGIRLYSSTALGRKLKPTSKEMKRRAFEAYFIFTQQEATSGGVQHNYLIEKDGKQGWINEMLVEFFHTLAFPFICNGIEVPKVKEINKGEGLSELADLISFITIRHCYDLIENKEIFFDSKALGKVRYCMVNKNANFLVSEGVPIRLFDI